MTNEEMVAALKAAGWTVLPPITQETCKHPPSHVRGSGLVQSDGGGYYAWHCLLCGKHEQHDYKPYSKPIEMIWNGWPCYNM